jgi:hypothetical protein
MTPENESPDSPGPGAVNSADAVPFEAADLDGLMIGEAFMKYVIQDVEVQKLAPLIDRDEPYQRNVLDCGQFPGRDYNCFRWPVAEVEVEFLVQQFGSARPPNGFDYEFPRSVRMASVFLSRRMNRLFSMLRGGELIGIGVFSATGQEIAVSETLWARPGLSIDIRTNDLIEDVGGRPETRWVSLKLLRPVDATDVARPTPSILKSTATAGEERSALPTSIKAETDCRGWLSEEAKKHPKKNPFGTKDTAYKHALAKFPRLSNRAFNRVWDTVMAGTGATWKKPGRPTNK